MFRKGPLIGDDTLPLIRRLWRDWMRPHARTLSARARPRGARRRRDRALSGADQGRLRRLHAPRTRRAILLAPLFVIAVTAVKGFSLLALTVLTNRVVTPDRGGYADGALRAPDRRRPRAARPREPGRADPALHHRFPFIKEALTRLSTVFLREVATIVALIAAMLWIDPVLTLVAAVTVPFIAHPIGRIGQKLRRVAVSTQEQIGQMASLVSESLAGARIAKTYGLEGYLKAQGRRRLRRDPAAQDEGRQRARPARPAARGRRRRRGRRRCSC